MELLGQDPDEAGRDHADSTAAGRDRWLAFAVIGCSAGALAVALVLTSGTGEAGAVAPGCGPGSGCAEVLGSRWSRVLGLKTAMLAFFTHVLLIAATLPVAGLAGWQLRARPLVRQAAAAAVLGAAAWFLYLQAFEIGAFCRWCTAAHALGGLAAAGTFLRDARRIEAGGVLLGLAAAGALAAIQVMNPPAATIREAGASGAPAAADSAANTAAGGAASAAAPADAKDPTDPAAPLRLLGGRLEVDPAVVPAIGPADATERAVVLVDYACPHCRVAHGLLLARGVRVFVLPVPLNAACNPGINRGAMPARFDDSCTLAELGVAVFLSGGEAAYARYDAAAFGGDAPPSADEAEALAAELAPAMTDADRGAARAAVSENVSAWLALGAAGIADRVPVLVDPASGRTAVGRLYGADDLDALFGAPAPAAPAADPP
ncbi:vitamin K epoxide reductase family protein [Phycisphaera mikurensis]|uniref:Vitamin K epoxide reductase domain-containing protein n=1 Tax=Phycisphaera mikurensis (strain NBRC 102666 / KCTC 22515 / FYK2301M01) TaxID=1142394 RepID=I0IAG1_PHYMF|nr:vitamin K epoxide reductase family protein [Phycisphaera mikurensis]MBB6441754.1 putative membrane protein [Phycisphaera mikurensis]BAM02249.1 hypothetical protein PSMK_00900 [Phycisphaera mikurensis NBRC 102666]